MFSVSITNPEYSRPNHKDFWKYKLKEGDNFTSLQNLIFTPKVSSKHQIKTLWFLAEQVIIIIIFAIAGYFIQINMPLKLYNFSF